MLRCGEFYFFLSFSSICVLCVVLCCVVCCGFGFGLVREERKKKILVSLIMNINKEKQKLNKKNFEQ